MISILFVCHGNICRSPMAEFVMADLVERAGLADSFHIESAATSAEELGNPVHRETRKILHSHNIDCTEKRARQMKPADYEEFDILIGMDAANVRSMKLLCGGDPEGKISKLLDFCGEDRSIADPWYTGDFNTTYHDVRKGCSALLQQVMRKLAS
ncbi:MAG: low molecular weight protein-tyrosine-phosphatase [Eggerthellaceae bacterium]|nr:low molecular weight protein-tyrosine-phosphatase [Eggerthellaceae bacterium]